MRADHRPASSGRPQLTSPDHSARRLIGVLCAVALLLMLSATKAVAADPSSFTASPTSGTAPLTVKFTITYDGAECWTYDWDFGDGGKSTDTNPTHVYTKPGTYTATVYAYYNSDACSPRVAGNDRTTTADVGCDGYCYFSSTTINVAAAPSPPPTTPPTSPPPTKQPANRDNSDDSDSDNSDSSDNSDDSDGTVVAIPRTRPTPTATPTSEPTEPSPRPTTPVNPTPPTPPTPPTEPDHLQPASWITGSGAPSAGLALMILAAVIGALGRVGGLSMAGRKVALVADRDENTVQRHVEARDAEGWGDRSFTWRFPGHGVIDAASVVIPDRFARLSPLLGRLTEDGSEFRAMFGTLWLATPLAGIALGFASLASVSGRALPPSAWLLIAGAVLAAFDAFSGALAIVVFAVGALLGDAAGGPDFVHSLLVVLAIGFLWMAIPLVGSAIRPFRRLGDGSLRHRWDVTADGVIAALLCGWVAQKLVQAMDLFAGQKTGLPDDANIVAFVVMAAVALRVTMEHFSMSAYPRRLQQVEGEDPPPPLLISSILGAFVRTAIFGFIGFAFIGSCWQLWLGVGLFLIPQLIEHIREGFPNFGLVRRILPRGVVEIFILIVACTLAARFAMSQSADQLTGLRLAFLLIAIPPALIGTLAMLAEDDDADNETTWPREFLGAVIVAVTTVLAAHGWDY